MLNDNRKINCQIIIILLLICSQSVIESVNAGLRVAWINHSGCSPLNRVTVYVTQHVERSGRGCGVLACMDVGASVYNCYCAAAIQHSLPH